MRAQLARPQDWRCQWCSIVVPSGFAHKCLEFDKSFGGPPECGWPNEAPNLNVENAVPLLFYDSPSQSRRLMGLIQFIERNPGATLVSIQNLKLLAADLREVCGDSDTRPKDGDAKQGSTRE